VDSGYRTLPFPLPELQPPEFVLEQRWTLAELAGYARTWSATARYVDAHGHDPVDALEAELRRTWSHPDERRVVRWPLALRVGTPR
jgi:hypothetical protein